MSIYSHDERFLKDATQQHTLISVFTLPAFVTVQRSNSSSYVIQVFAKRVQAAQLFVYYLPWRGIPSELLITAGRIKSVFWKCKKSLLPSFRSILASDKSTYKMWFHKSSNSDRHLESERPKGLELKISPECSQVPLGKNLWSREKKEAKNKWEVIRWPKNRKRTMMKFGQSIFWEMDFYSPKFFHLWPLCFPRPF